MDFSLYVPNRTIKSEKQACCWCDRIKTFLTENPLHAKCYLQTGEIFNCVKYDVTYVCQVLRFLLPCSITENKKWSFDNSTIQTYYPDLARSRFVLLIRLLELIALKRQRVQSRQKYLSLAGIPEMIALDNQNALEHQNMQFRQKLHNCAEGQAVQKDICIDFDEEFLDNFFYLQELLKVIALERQEAQTSLGDHDLNEMLLEDHQKLRLLEAHQKLWNGLSSHFDCYKELCEAMSEPLITINEMKAFLCYILHCDESNEVVQDICFEYEREFPLYQPRTLNELSQYALLKSLNKAKTLPHGLHQLCIPNRLKHVLIKMK